MASRPNARRNVASRPRPCGATLAAGHPRSAPARADGYREVFAFKKLPWSLVDEPAGKAEATTEPLTDDDLRDDLGGGPGTASGSG
jgi:hypothetical protein